MARLVDCHAIASTLISEHGGNVETETTAGTDHLTIVRVGNTLQVTAHHDSAQVADDADVYRITSETVDFISAVQGLKPLPVVHGLVMNKRLGSAVWTESDSTFVLVSDYPSSSSVFLHCTN